VKNLVSHTETKTVGDLQSESIILEYLWYLKKKGRSRLTLDAVNNRLSQLARAGLNLLQPEEISSYISEHNWKESTKKHTVSIYGGFLRFRKIAWDPPEYKAQRQPYILPHDEDIEQLISAAGRKLSPFLLVIKETAARKGEAVQLKWTHVDLQRKLISITPEKGGNPRTLPISERLAEVLRCLKRETELVFTATLSSISSNYYQQRLKIARKTGNPRLLKIGLHDFRHWKLTQIAKEFNGNAHYIQYFAGHKDLNTQQIYVHLAEQYYGRSASQEFVVELAKNVEEAKKLIAVGFEFVHEFQGVMMYRKRK
jgi:integrase